MIKGYRLSLIHIYPYTQALLSAVPIPDPHVKMERIILEGDIPSPVNPPSGCKFHTRCKYCMDICKEQAPEYKEYEKDHFVACHLCEINAEKGETATAAQDKPYGEKEV